MIKFTDLINLEDDTDITKAIEALKQFNRVLNATAKSAEKLKQADLDTSISIVTQSESLVKATEKVTTATAKSRAEIARTEKQAELMAKSYKAVRDSASDYDKYLKDIGKEQENVTNTTKKLEDINKKYQKTREELNKNEVEAINLSKKASAQKEAEANTTKRAADEEIKKGVVSKATKDILKKNVEIREKIAFQDNVAYKTNVKLNIQLQEKTKLLKQEAVEALKPLGAYQQQSNTLNKLRNTYKNVAAQFGENSKEAKLLYGEMNKLDVKLKGIDKSAGQGYRSVGLYGDSVKALTPIMGSFGGQIGMITTQLGMIKTSVLGFAKAQKASAVASGGASSALKVFRLALLATGIGAIVIGIGALIAAFASTQEGMDKITAVTKPLQVIFSRLLGVIQKLSLDAFGGLSKAIDNPKKAFKELGESIKENVINRFKSIMVFGSALSLLFKGKFSEAAKKAADGFIQFGTGIEDGTDKLIKAKDAVVDFVAESVDMGTALNDMTIAFEKAQLRSIVPLAKMRDEYEKLKEIGQDQTKTDQERIKALDDAANIQRKIFATEKDLIDKEVRLLEFKLDLNKTLRSESKELEELKAKQYEKEAAAQRQINATVSLRSGIEKRIAAEIQSRLDNEEKRLAEINGARLEQIEALNKRIKKSTEDLVQSRIEEEIRLADMGVKLGDDKIQSLERRIELEISLERRKSAELIKIKDQELKDIGAKKEEDLKKSKELFQKQIDNQDTSTKEGMEELNRLIESQKTEEVAINNKYNDILSQTKEAQKVEIVQIQEDLENETTKITEKGAQERDQITKEEIKQRIANIEQGVNALFDFGNQIGELASALDEREKQRDEEKFTALEEKRDKEVALAGENQEAKLFAEKKYEDEKAKIEKEAAKRARKIAVFEKTLAIGQAIVGTALGVAKALPNIPLSILVGLLGGVQVATIAAQPIPAFAKGTDYAPAGDKIVGELGRELVVTPSGKSFLTGNKAEVRTDIPEGSQILTNAITENILASESIDKNEQDAIKISKGANKAHQLSSDMIRQMDRKNDDIVQGFKEAVGGIEVHQWRLGNGGLKKDIRRGNTTYKDVEQENTF